MKILVITNHFWPEDFRVNELTYNLAEKGHDVTVLTGIPNYPEGKFFPGYGLFRKRTEVHNGVTIHRMPLVPRGSGRRRNLAINYLTSAISFCLLAIWYGRKKYDATFVFNTSPATIGLPAIIIKWLYKTPIVMWVLDLWPESISATAAIRNNWILSVIRRLMKFIYSQCDRIMVSSKGFEQSIQAIGGYKGKFEYFPNWIEQEHELATNKAPVNPPVLPTFPSGFKIVFTGNIGVAQNFGTVIDAAEKLKSFSDIHWVIVGDGRVAEELKAEVTKRGLGSNFHVPGRFPPETMQYFFNQADALLLPLRRVPIFALTVPRKLQAYLAGGKPIIAAIEGAGAEIVEDAKAGLSCEAQNPDAMAATVLKLYEMPVEERAAMGLNGQRYSEEHFDSTTLFAKLDTVLSEVTGIPNELDWASTDEDVGAMPVQTR